MKHLGLVDEDDVRIGLDALPDGSIETVAYSGPAPLLLATRRAPSG